LTGLLEKCIDWVPWWLRDRVRQVPGLKQAQQHFFNRFLSGREFNYEISAGPAKGLVFPISLPQDKLIWTGTCEKEVAETIAANIRPGDICLDIGSHRGFMAGIMALASHHEVFCFEPNPENQAHLEKLRELNPALKLKLVNLAVSDSIGQAEFSIMPESSMGKLKDSGFQSDADQSGWIRVDTRTLDSLLEDQSIAPPNFIKIDVEGAEVQVLRGAEQLIERCHPVMVIELHTSELARECSELLRCKGYSAQIIQEGISLQSKDGFSVCHLLARWSN
jgi:FkbM family methyltransferase